MKSRGASLLEIIIALGVLAILATAITVNLFKYRREQELDSAARTIISLLRDAQQKAITQQEGFTWGVRFTNYSSSIDVMQVFKGETIVGQTCSNPCTLNCVDPPCTVPILTVTLSPALDFTDPAPDVTKDIAFVNITGAPNPLNNPPLFENKIVLQIKNNASMRTIYINNNGTITY